LDLKKLNQRANNNCSLNLKGDIVPERYKMLVKPNKNYKMLWTNKCVWVDQTYKATIATNQPNYKEKGAIFVNEILLEKGEYTIIEK